MSKKMISLAMAVAFVAGFAAISFAGKCKVTAVEGTKVTVDCAGKVETAEGTAKVGDMVMVKDGKVQAAKKRKAIEGC